MGKLYFPEIDVVKGIAILTVVLEHSFALNYIDTMEFAWCNTVVSVIQSFNMQLFFIVSGFLFSYTKDKGIVESIKSKVNRLLVPYFFLSFVTFVVKSMLPSMINGDNGSVYQMTIDVFLRGGFFWFIYTLFGIFLIAILFKNKLTDKIILGVIPFLVFLCETGVIDTDFLRIYSIAYFSVYFLVGMLLKDVYSSVKNIAARWYVIALSIFMYAVLYFMVDIEFINRWILPVLLAIPILGGAVFVSDHFLSQPFIYLGVNSLQFYMFNGFALVISRVLVIKVLGINNVAVAVLLVFILCMLLLYIATEITRRIPHLNYLCGFTNRH